MDPADARRILEGERERGLAQIGAAATLDELEQWKVALLGRKAPWSEVQRSLGTVDPDARRELGRLSNEVKSALEEASTCGTRTHTYEEPPSFQASISWARTVASSASTNRMS